MEPEQARAAMAKFQALTSAMLTADDWQDIGQGRRFVKRSGWRKVATGYTLSCDIVEEEVVDRDDKGEPIRARAKVRVYHRESGRSWEGTGRASTTERKFSKPEHDVTSTAVTRAINRATSDLVGFGQVSAEELDGTGVVPASPYGESGTAETDTQVANAIRGLYPAVDGDLFVGFFRSQLGVEHVPQTAARMVAAIKWALGDERVRAITDPPDAEVVS
jgi:hypothetical protein